MKRVIGQLFVLLLLFFSAWFLFSRIDWMTLFRVEQNTQKSEEKIGEMFWDYFQRAEEVNESETLRLAIDSLVDRICLKNLIDTAQMKIHILDKDEVNAFAMPDHHLVLFTGLIADCKNEAELCGVLSHEIAHMEQRHVMKKLGKELGLTAVIALTGANVSTEIIGKALRMLSSSAYDRELEQEADDKAVEYMIRANIDAEAFAHFLFRMSEEKEEIPEAMYWISTHPASGERARTIIESLKHEKLIKKQILSAQTWENVKSEVE